MVGSGESHFGGQASELISDLAKGAGKLVGPAYEAIDMIGNFYRDENAWGMTYVCNKSGPCAPLVWKN